jgi:translation initiation factor IF-3
LSHPSFSRGHPAPASAFRINNKIRAKEVRVIGVDGNQLGVMNIQEAMAQARNNGVDLIEIAPNATPPVCRLVDYGKFRYESAKKEKDSKKHQHANKVKEIQLSPTINEHDFKFKLAHAIDFLCDEMKIKLTLRFRGREMAHQQFGFQIVNNFIKELNPFAHVDAPPKLIGKGINVMLSPLPRNKRAKNPNTSESYEPGFEKPASSAPAPSPDEIVTPPIAIKRVDSNQAPAPQAPGFANNPFEDLKVEPEK